MAAIPSNIPGFHSVILSPAQLTNHPCLSPLKNLINRAFDKQHTVLGRDEDDILDRFATPSAVVSKLGINGRCCVLFRSEDVVDKNDLTRPVAISMIINFSPNPGSEPLEGSWREVTVSGHEKEPEDILSISDWEPACVAVLPGDPSLAQKGLAIECVRQVEQDLLKRLDIAERQRQSNNNNNNNNKNYSNGTDLTNGDKKARGPLTFWIRAGAKTAAPYWERRGYDVVGVQWFAKGMWKSKIDFQIVTLKREVLRN